MVGGIFMKILKGKIWYGISSVMSIWPARSVYETFVVNYKSDEELLRSDWLKVGNDIKFCMETLLEEEKDLSNLQNNIINVKEQKSKDLSGNTR